MRNCVCLSFIKVVFILTQLSCLLLHLNNVETLCNVKGLNNKVYLPIYSTLIPLTPILKPLDDLLSKNSLHFINKLLCSYSPDRCSIKAYCLFINLFFPCFANSWIMYVLYLQKSRLAKALYYWQNTISKHLPERIIAWSPCKADLLWQ